jgi:plasmid replication initiation protein
MAAKSYPGTTFDKRHGRWKARTTINGVSHALGYHATQEAAFAAIVEAKSATLWSMPGAAPAMAPVTSPLRAPDIAPLIAGSAQFVSSEIPEPERDFNTRVTRVRKNTHVAQHNFLVEAPIALTLLEARIFVLMLRCLHKRDTSSLDIVIPLADLMKGIPLAKLGGRNYQLLHAAIDSLMNFKLELPVINRKKDKHVINLLQSMHLDSGNGILVGVFAPVVLPYLTNLADNYTLGEVAELMSLKSASSHRFYWLMKAWEFRSPITVTVEKLRSLTTGKGSYAQYADFRNKVLHPSIDELNGLNFEIAYTENKKGRAVDSIEFKIAHRELKDSDTSAVVIEEPKPSKSKSQRQLSLLEINVVKRLRKLQLTEAQINKVIAVLEGNADNLTKLMKVTHPLLVAHETKAKPGDNVGASTVALLKTNFPTLYHTNS